MTSKHIIIDETTAPLGVDYVEQPEDNKYFDYYIETLKYHIAQAEKKLSEFQNKVFNTKDLILEIEWSQELVVRSQMTRNICQRLLSEATSVEAARSSLQAVKEQMTNDLLGNHFIVYSSNPVKTAIDALKGEWTSRFLRYEIAELEHTLMKAQ